MKQKLDLLNVNLITITEYQLHSIKSEEFRDFWTVWSKRQFSNNKKRNYNDIQYVHTQQQYTNIHYSGRNFVSSMC